MEQAAKAVPAEVFHHRHAIEAGDFRNGAANVAETGAGFDGIDAGHHRFIGHIHQAFGFALHLANAIHAGVVAVPAVKDAGHVNIGDVAFLERLCAGDAVADHMVDRNAGRVAISAVADGRRLRTMIEHELAHQVVEIFRGDTRFHFADQHVEAFGHDAARPAHACEPFRIVDADFASAHGQEGCCVIHGSGFQVSSAECGSD